MRQVDRKFCAKRPARQGYHAGPVRRDRIPQQQLIEYYVDGVRIGTAIRVVPSPGDGVTAYRSYGGSLGRFRVLSVAPAVHPSTGRPPRAAACHLTPLSDPSGGQGGIAPSPGDEP